MTSRQQALMTKVFEASASRNKPVPNAIDYMNKGIRVFLTGVLVFVFTPLYIPLEMYRVPLKE